MVFGAGGQNSTPLWATVNAVAIQCHGTRGISTTTSVWKRYYYAGGVRMAVSEPTQAGTILKRWKQAYSMT